MEKIFAHLLLIESRRLVENSAGQRKEAPLECVYGKFKVVYSAVLPALKATKVDFLR